MLHNQYPAPTRQEAFKAYELFVLTSGEKYPKAMEFLMKDKEDLFSFYDFPAAHWLHLCTTNSSESSFATVRLRHRKTKGSGTCKATLAMVHEPCREGLAQTRWIEVYPPGSGGYKVHEWRAGS
jgi:putative transposase